MVDTLLENVYVVRSGWMPGEKQYCTGPLSFTTAIIALHCATSDEPRITGTFLSMTPRVSCTAICGLD